MRIIYVTTAQEEKDYRSFMKLWKISLNASNQNFHNKLIRALSLDNHVDVISIRPFSRHNLKIKKLVSETKKEENITWHYLKRSGNRIIRNINLTGEMNKAFSAIDTKEAIILVDTINPALLREVLKINKKYHLPIIGICTDSPSNISKTSRSYTMYILDKTKDFDGYIALTDGLKDLFNPNNKPSYIFEGLVEERQFPKHEEDKKPYLFFGGALMERYGVYNLISAFNDLNNSDIDLYICGHHGDKQKLKEAFNKKPNIKFLGLLPVNKVMEYEHNALACINPRPYSEDLDRFSIPSKTLEYLVSGRPVISVKNSKLMEKFPKDIIWIKSSDKDDIKEGINKVLSMTEVQRQKLGEEAKNRALKLYSLENIGGSITSFLKQFVR